MERKETILLASEGVVRSFSDVINSRMVYFRTVILQSFSCRKIAAFCSPAMQTADVREVEQWHTG